MDTGLWATWYNLDDADRPGFLAWAHEVYLPHLRGMDGVLWAAHYANEGGGPGMDRLVKDVIGHTEDDIGDGSQFVILVGAAAPHTFFNPYIPEVHWPEGFDAMLAKRKGTRQAILAEVHRIAGPAGEATTTGGAPGPYIQMGSFRMSREDKDFEIGKWYSQFRFPYMAQMPGSIATRKYVGVAGWAKHAIMYEFTSAEARMEQFEIKHETHGLDTDAWHNDVIPYTVHSPGSPVIGPRLWPPVAAD